MPDPSKFVVTPRAGNVVEVRMTEAAWKEIQELLTLSRSMVRDVAHDWPVKELAGDPEDVCNRITEVLGDEYDFETGNDTTVVSGGHSGDR